MKSLANNGRVSHFDWDKALSGLFSVSSDLGTTWIKANSSSAGNSETVIYQPPQINVGSDTSQVLIWVGVGVAVLVLAVVLILILKK